MIGFPLTRATFRGSLGEGLDAERIHRLATLSTSRPPEGVVLLAEREGEPVAAIGLFDGHTVADPARSNLAVRLRLHLLRLQLRLIVSVHGL
ncbi:MAG: hypothetical protein JO262_00525 [Solirubrobacterales bacterium]|nr:hypothetical protein [Solirubrobacterales bacterium]MBV9940582.1 hypothetical protein [Solirubrobacterales bacterium]